jgi:hypothetical protein
MFGQIKNIKNAKIVRSAIIKKNIKQIKNIYLRSVHHLRRW